MTIEICNQQVISMEQDLISRVGHKGKTKSSVDVLPMGKVKTMQDDNMPENRIPMYGQKSRY
jgi:hypothetical protein